MSSTFSPTFSPTVSRDRSLRLCRAIWIQEEKELLQEVAGMGELREPWHTKQIELLDRHLHLLHLYSQAKENLTTFKGG